ncbi:MAG TPA: hypothetical protein PLZ93_05780 [Nocardioides sp.]|nr:hypothetical protein [Nocardioides sp.]HRI95100.1 hypothetical protein [Nocardioides sp.]
MDYNFFEKAQALLQEVHRLFWGHRPAADQPNLRIPFSSARALGDKIESVVDPSELLE